VSCTDLNGACFPRTAPEIGDGRDSEQEAMPPFASGVTDLRPGRRREQSRAPASRL